MFYKIRGWRFDWDNIKYKIVVLFLSIIGLGSSTLFNQEIKWKGTVEKNGETTVIRNPEDSLYGRIKYDLKEDLRIGQEKDEKYIFHQISGIALDSHGSIYISDMGNHRIQKYDSYGKYVRTIGRKGQGPGEFEQPNKIVIDENNDELYVQDGSRKIKCFSKDGIYLNEVFFIKSFIDFCLAENGCFIVQSKSTSSMNHTTNIYKIDSTGEVLLEIANYPYYCIIQGNLGNNFLVNISGYEYDLFLANCNRENFIFGFSEKYLLTVLNKDGKIKFAIGREGSARKFPANLSKKFKKSMFFNKIPPHEPFFYALFCDSEGRIYVQTNNTMYEPGIKIECDVFNKSGYYLYRTELPHGTCLIRDGFLYTHLEDEDAGIEYVKRLKIENWNKLKKE